MKKLSAIIIAKNEEGIIADCIDSLLFCDEIIVIDGESEDRTKEIAKKMGALVYTHTFEDFAITRNFGLHKATSEWVFYVDADERVSPALQDNIKHHVLNRKYGDKISAYKVKRKNFYLGNHEWPYIESMERIFKREALKGWYGVLHETPKIEGNLDLLEGFLLHYTHRDLTGMLAKTIAWSSTEAKLRHNAHHPKMTWWRFPRVMIPAFYNSYITQKGYKVGIVGIVESMYQAFSMFITYTKLWELQKKR